jgi:hypothetical protein
MEQSVAELNEFVKAIELHLEGPDVRRTVNHLIVGGAYFRPTPPALYRVFNRGSFSLGGRSYGWWQALPKAHRQALLINGEPAVEPDFRQMHPAILYALRGLRLDHDPYETGIFSRQEGKLAFNVALNAASLQGAIAALSNKNDWVLSREETARLIHELKRRNPGIADALHADQGVRLMRLDSEIMMLVMRCCMKEKIAALPVHDSVLTPARHGLRVAAIMEESAARVLKVGKPCLVSLPASFVPHMPYQPVQPIQPVPDQHRLFSIANPSFSFSNTSTDPAVQDQSASGIRSRANLTDEGEVG